MISVGCPYGVGVLCGAQTSHIPSREVAHDEIVDRIRYRTTLGIYDDRRFTGAGAMAVGKESSHFTIDWG